MDLRKRTIGDDDTYELHLNDPETGKPLWDGDPENGGVRVFLILTHADAPGYRKQQRDLLNRRRKNAVLRTALAQDDPQGEAEKQAIEEMALAIVGWQGIGWGSEQMLECTFDNACMILTEAPWMFEQVAVATRSRANFMKRSPID